MSNETHRIRIASDSELGRMLDAAGEASVLLEKNGKLYRLVVESEADLWGGYDPEKARAALREMAGSWADIDTDQLIDELYRARDEGARPLTRP